MKRGLGALFIGLMAGGVLSACSLAPDYHVPATPEPAAYKEAGNWVQAKPVDALPRGAWWKVYGDPALDTLEDKVTAANQNLKAAVAQYDQAREAARAARAAYFPLVTGTADATQNRLSATTANVAPNRNYKDYLLQGDVSYEVDLWGRVRNLVASAEAEAQASAADLAGVDLSLHAEMAADYFALRGDDARQKILDQTVKAYGAAFDLASARYKGDIAPETDVDQAQSQFETAKTEAEDLRLQRAQLEHAMAVLTGEAPADFSLAAHPIAAAPPPALTPGMPSTLLERRPDIASAERNVVAANAEIGVARAAYFPQIDLGASAGVESAVLSSLIGAPSLFWSLGPSSMLTIFDAGRIDAQTEEAKAAYRQTVANYRQTVLSAYQDVEDNLAALRQLDRESRSAMAASAAANRALSRETELYKGGAATYLDVIVAQNIALQAQLSAADILARRMMASVQLVKALGGGWKDSY